MSQPARQECGRLLGSLEPPCKAPRAFVPPDQTFVDVPRALLRHADLCNTDCIILAWTHFRQGRRRTPSLRELAWCTGTSTSTVSKARKRLRSRGWLDVTNRPARALPVPTKADQKADEKKASFVRVHFADLQAHRRGDALVLGQLRTLHNVPKARTEDHQTLAAPGFLAHLLGRKREPGSRARRSRDAMRMSLRRLESGETTGHRVEVRRAQRADQPAPTPAPIISLEMHARSTKLVFRWVSERERRAKMATTRAESTKQGKPSGGYVYGAPIPDAERDAMRAGLELIKAHTRPPGPSVRAAELGELQDWPTPRAP